MDMNTIYPILPSNRPYDERQGVTPEAIDALEQLLSTYSREQNPTISLEAASVRGEFYTDLYLEVTGRFRKAEDLYIVTPVGILNVSELVRELKKLL